MGPNHLARCGQCGPRLRKMLLCMLMVAPFFRLPGCGGSLDIMTSDSGKLPPDCIRVSVRHINTT